MKIKGIKKIKNLDSEIIALIVIGGLALGNLCFNLSQKKDSYVAENGEYWISEESYNEYLNYKRNENITSVSYFITSYEDGEKYPVYEFPVGEKYVYGYVDEKFYYDGNMINRKTPVYDFCSNEPLVEPELVEASDGKFYLGIPDYYLDEKGEIHTIDGSAKENIDKKLEKNKKLMLN